MHSHPKQPLKRVARSVPRHHVPTVVKSKGELPQRRSNGRDEGENGKDRVAGRQSGAQDEEPDSDRSDGEKLTELTLGSRHQRR